MKARQRLIGALDFGSSREAMEAARSLRGALQWLKVGAVLFTAEGPGIVRDLKNEGYKIFLDLKFHDIPATVGAACRNAARLGVDMMNVHALGGKDMMAAATEGAAQGAGQAGFEKPLVIAVTALTSMGPADVKSLGMDMGLEDLVKHLAGQAQQAGLDGVVASAREVSLIKEAYGTGFAVVTPGIRPSWASVDDQKRIMTPKEAVAQGADYLVVGRPIFKADDPEKAALMTLQEMEG